MVQKSITETESIAENFNKYFPQIGPNFSKDIGTSNKNFSEWIKKHGTTQLEKVISVNEFKDAFFSLKINESAGYDDISFNVVIKNVLEFYINVCCTYLILLYKLAFFQINSRLLHHSLKEVKTMNYETTGLYLCYHASQKFWEKLCIITFTSILLKALWFSGKTSH